MREDGHVLVIGAAGLDIKGRSHAPLQSVTSNPGQIRNSFGGVGRNIAENLARLEIKVVLLTVVGDDASGDLIMAQVAAAGVDVTHTVQIKGSRSGSFMAILDDEGDLFIAVSDYEIMTRLDADFLDQQATLFDNARLVVMDLNMGTEAIAKIVELCQRYEVPLCVDPTSPAHAGKIRDYLSHLYLITPNAAETSILCDTDDPSSSYEVAIQAAHSLVAAGTQIAILTLGDKGVAYATSSASGHITLGKTQVVDSTGAGDALSAAVIFGLLNDFPLDEAMRLGMTAAVLTLHSRESVVPELTPDLLYEHLIV